jgi:hypothetical protein
MPKCKNCGERAGKEWKFCPFCGNELIEGDFFSDVKRVFEGFGINTKRSPEKKGFTIRIKTGKGPVIKFKTGKGAAQEMISKFMRMPENPIEPKTEVSKFLNEMKINVQLPGVKKLNNVLIKRVGESIEIRALSKNKGYFKVLHVPSEFILESKKLNKGTLELRLKV